jgi:hypothetical protein
MKNKFWLTSITTQNITLKHKNFDIIPLIFRKIDAEKTRFQPAKTQKMTISQDVGIQNFQVIYEEQMMAHIQNHKNHDFETSKFHHFSSYPQSYRC